MNAVNEALALELAKCIGAIRGAADAMKAQGWTGTATALREVSEDALAVLVQAGIEIDRAAA